MQLTILGGGGFRVPLVYRALLGDAGSPRVDRVVQHDVDRQRLAVMRTLLGQLADGHDAAPAVTTTTVLDEAVQGSDFVFSAIRVGGTRARVRDERVALSLGVLGQETTGPGGIAYALRTVPVALHVARRIRELAPQAYVLNFTNPAGLITEAMQSVLGDRVVGICDTPSGLGRRLALALGVDPAEVELDYVGLNHLGWMRGVRRGGRELLPSLLDGPEQLAGLEEADLFGADWIRSLGAVPNEYLYYYYCTRDAVRSIVSGEHTRGEFLLAQQRAFYAAAAAHPERALETWRETLRERNATYLADARGDQDRVMSSVEESGGYEQVALAVLTAVARDERAVLILDVRNGSALPGMDADAVVELPTVVDAAGVHPVPTTRPDLHQLGLMQQVKAVERLAIEAAVTGSPDAALRAFALHPLVDSVSVARALLDGYVEALPEVAAVLRPT